MKRYSIRLASNYSAIFNAARAKKGEINDESYFPHHKSMMTM